MTAIANTVAAPMLIEAGDIFSHQGGYILVLKADEEHDSDSFHIIPAIRVSDMPGVEAFETPDVEALGFRYRDWSDVGLPGVFLHLEAVDLVTGNQLRKLERVSYCPKSAQRLLADWEEVCEEPGWDLVDAINRLSEVGSL